MAAEYSGLKYGYLFGSKFLAIWNRQQFYNELETTSSKPFHHKSDIGFIHDL